MKVKLYRHSGRIVDDDKMKLFIAEWGPLFDKILERAGAILDDKSNRLSSRNPQTLVERLSRYAERQLLNKYGRYEMIELPKNAKQWKTLVDKWGPVYTARELVTNNIILVIADNL